MEELITGFIKGLVAIVFVCMFYLATIIVGMLTIVWCAWVVSKIYELFLYPQFHYYIPFTFLIGLRLLFMFVSSWNRKDKKKEVIAVCLCGIEGVAEEILNVRCSSLRHQGVVVNINEQQIPR